MTTKQEALKHLDELEAKVDSQKALRLGAEKEVDDLAKANEDLKHQAKVEYDRAERLLKERDRLQFTLNGYADLGKALGKIKGDAVDPEAIRRVVKEEVAKLTPDHVASTDSVQVNESVPYMNLKVSSPWLTLDESTVEGQVSVIALHGKLPEKFGFGAVVKAIEQEYSAHPRRATIQKALDDLVGKYKTLERRVEGNQLVYSLRSDAKSRVKESETREAVEAKE